MAQADTAASQPGMGVTKSISSGPLFSDIYSIVKHMLVIKCHFTFDRCRRS